MLTRLSAFICLTVIIAGPCNAQSSEVRTIVERALKGQDFDPLRSLSPTDEMTQSQLASLLTEVNELRGRLENVKNPNDAREENIRFLELVIMDLRSYAVKMRRISADQKAGFDLCSQRPMLAFNRQNSDIVRFYDFPWEMSYGAWDKSPDVVWKSIARSVRQAFFSGNNTYNNVNEIRFRQQYISLAQKNQKWPYPKTYNEQRLNNSSSTRRFWDFYQIPMYCIIAAREWSDLPLEMKERIKGVLKE